MFEKFYTTKMSENGKILQHRFAKMRTNVTKRARFASYITLAVIMSVFAFGACLAAAAENAEIGNGTLIINGERHTVDIRHFDCEKYPNSDKYYLPLRKVFEYLNCTVNYDVDKSTVPDFMKGNKAFPQYAWDGEERYAVDEISEQMYGATTSANTNMPIIEIVSPKGKKYYCQVGSCIFNGMWTPPVVVSDGKAYVSVRAIAMYLVPDEISYKEASMIGWDDIANDTYYEGRLTLDEENMTVTINENEPVQSKANNTALNLGREIIGRIESKKYLVVQTRDNAITVISKKDGSIFYEASYPDFNKDIYIASADENTVTLNTFDPNAENGLKEFDRIYLRPRSAKSE